MITLLHRLATPLALVLLCLTALADDWTRFRGPNGSGVRETTGLPTEFGPERNLAWKMEVPYGSSSPVISEDRIFLTASDEESLIVQCLDQATGRTLWKQSLKRARTDEMFKDSDSAIPTPVLSGDSVFAFFPEFGLVSYDHDGRLRWSLALGPFVSFYGMASSPILAGDTLVLQCDQQQHSFLIAVDAETGKERWRKERGRIESWSTPIVHPPEAPTQVIAFGSFWVDAYSLETGEKLWESGGLGYTPVCSPIVQGESLFACVPYHAEQPLPPFEGLAQGFDTNKDGKISKAECQGELGEHFGWADSNKDDFIDEAEWKFVTEGMASQDHGLVSLKIGASGSPTETWRYKKSLPSIASPLLYRDVLYLVKNGGIITTLDPATGEEKKRERLGTTGDCFPSPVASDGKIFIATNGGEIAVLEAGADWKLLAVNQLDEEIFATPAIGDGRLFIRTKKSLFCFRQATGGE